MVTKKNTEEKATNKDIAKESSTKVAKNTVAKKETTTKKTTEVKEQAETKKPATSKASTKNTIKVKQIASGAGRLKKQIATLKGLGLNKVNREVELEDTLAVRGMINKVKHLVKVI